tara:strand:- start:27025 stop:27528 length:504 start_codon:yes stop_codon:yes gene_type:complete
MRKTLVLLLLFVGLVCVGVSSGAYANTDRNYSGSSCQPDKGAHAYIDLNNGAYNNPTSTSYKYVWCPVTAMQSSTVNFDEIRVAVYDSYPTGKVRCTAFSKTAGGTTYASSAEDHDVSGGTFSYITFTGSELPNAGSTMYSVISNSLYCRLYPDQAIVGFSVDTVYN